MYHAAHAVNQEKAYVTHDILSHDISHIFMYLIKCIKKIYLLLRYFTFTNKKKLIDVIPFSFDHW